MRKKTDSTAGLEDLTAGGESISRLAALDMAFKKFSGYVAEVERNEALPQWLKQVTVECYRAAYGITTDIINSVPEAPGAEWHGADEHPDSDRDVLALIEGGNVHDGYAVAAYDSGEWIIDSCVPVVREARVVRWKEIS